MKNYSNKIFILIFVTSSFLYPLRQSNHLEWLSINELMNVGLYFRRLGNYPAALPYFKFAAFKDPLNCASKFELATAYLACKKLAKGFSHLDDFLKHQTPFKKIWQGESLLKKNILVFVPNWGSGDFFMFARYISLLKAFNPQSIIICAPQQLAAITQQFFPDTIIKTYNSSATMYDGLSDIYHNIYEFYYEFYNECYFTAGTLFENLPESDYQIHLFSLPALLNTTEKTIPCEFFTLTDASIQQLWKKQFYKDKKFKIGLYWQGALRHDPQLGARAIPLALLEPILKNKKYSFYSLQHGFGTEQLGQLDSEVSITLFDNIDTFNGSFVDTAAIIQNLDLVITIDTSIAHLAGILGTKVWLMLPYAADWRYQLDDTKSPWYPTMRIFRQPKPGDWKSVIDNIQKELVM